MELSSEVNFSLGFNDVDFSDRVLRLEITRSASDIIAKVRKCLPFSEVYDCKVKTLNICSLVLAAKSPFFYKLFKNGMKESQKKDAVTVRIHPSEEAAFLDVLSFIYDKHLNATSEAELMAVLMAADKFEVPSCVRHCSELLLKLPLTTESAVFYINHSSIAFVSVINPLIDEAERYLAGHFRDFTKSQQKEAMKLPLPALKAVLGSDGLQVDSEDVVFDIVLNWASLHYPKSEQRQEILSKHLLQVICFPNMSSSKLTKVVDIPELNNKEASKRILNALISSKDQVLTTKYDYPRRVYKQLRAKVVQLELAQPRCAVFLFLNRQECADLFPSKQLCSQTLFLGGRSLCLRAVCNQAKPAFGLFVATASSETCTLNLEIAVMNKTSKEFTRRATLKNCTVASNGWGWADLFTKPWTDFIHEESEYFIDGILHLRADITLIN